MFNETSSCIGLVFTIQPKLINESRVHSSLHSNYHQQIVYVIHYKILSENSLSSSIKTQNMELGKSKCWHHIRQAIANFSWDRALANLNVNEMVLVFDKTI